MIGMLGIRRHARVRTLLSSYVDGEVSEAEARRVEDHLSTCAECRVDLQTLRMSVELVRALPALDPTRSFTLDRAPDLARPPLTPVWATGMATSLAGLLLVVLLLGDASGLLAQTGAGDGVSAAEMQMAPTAPVAEPEAVAAPLAPSLAAPAPELAAAPEVAAATAQAPVAAAPAPVPKPAAALRAAVAAQAASPPPAEADTRRSEPSALQSVLAEPVVAEEAVEQRAEAPSVSDTARLTGAEAPAPPVGAEGRADVAAPTAKQPETAPDASEGLRLPLRQIELATGGLLVLLLATTLWLWFRLRWSPGRPSR